jgi:uncharacterized protein YbaR (Trm112 family)
MSILKCTKCKNTTNLALKPKTILFVEPLENLYMERNLETAYYLDGKATEELKDLVMGLNEISRVNEQPLLLDFDDIEKVHKFLDASDVIEGTITCENCENEYIISNGIPDFIGK